MIPSNIDKEHIVNAINEVNKNGIPKKRDSSKYILKYEGKEYPTKLIISLANKFANGQILDSENFSEGNESNIFLENLGYQIVVKNDPIKKLIEDYKVRIQGNHLKKEKYKWELVEKYKGAPDLEVKDFHQEIKSIKFKNLLYQMSTAVIVHLSKDRPEELRELFKYLFNETIELADRVEYFNKETLNLYREIGETHGHHQDERAIATYLTFNNSDKYTFYKNSFYSKYCTLLGVKKAKKNNKYVHYLELVNNLIDDYIVQDSELINLVKNYIPKHYDGTNHNVLAQDILFQMLDQEIDEPYKFEEIKNKFDRNVFETYEFYLRRIINELSLSVNDERIVFSVLDDKLSFTIGQRYCFNLYLSDKNGNYGIISKEKLLDNSEPFNEEKAPKHYYNYYVDFSPSESDWLSIIQSMQDELQRTTQSSFRKQNNSDFENYIFNKKTVLDETFEEQTMIPLNQILYGPPGTGKTYNTINKALEIIENKSQYELDQENREELKERFESYKLNGQIEFVTFHQSYGYEEFVEGIKANSVDGNISYDVEDGIFKRIVENAKQIKSEVDSLYDFDSGINIWKISLGDSQNSSDDYLFEYCKVHNKVLLGFGDGFNFRDCANRQEIANKLNDSDKYSYPPTAINILKNKMKKNDIVLVSHGNRRLRAIAKVTGEYEFLEDELLNNYVQSRSVEWLMIPEEPVTYEKVLKKQFSQMSIYDIKSNVKIDKLREVLGRDKKVNSDKKYILIIDEINRGNISKIFGELITLIEPSKRIGSEEEILLTLPNSSTSFGVPKNLYILGTMNTADRSIALIDTALRRRFDFQEMMPDTSLLDFDVVVDGENISIKNLLETINKRIEYLNNRDHMIGHAYFMSLEKKSGDNAKQELDNIFRNKIIPLLQEYFYDDWEKIQIVLGDHYDQLEGNKHSTKNDCKSFDDEKNRIRFIQSRKIHETSIIGFDHDEIEDESIDYKVNPNSFTKEAYAKLCKSK